MKNIDWVLVKLDFRILLTAAGLSDQIDRRLKLAVEILQAAVLESDGLMNRHDRRRLSELLPQTSKLWPESSDVYNFIKNLGIEAVRVSKMITELPKGYATDPVFIFGSKVAETKNLIYKSYDAVALWFAFAIGIGVGVILASIFWFLAVR